MDEEVCAEFVGWGDESVALGEDSSVYGFTGESPGDYVSRVAGGGDVNGDGVADFMIGAKKADVGGMDRAGKVYLFLGGDWGSPATIDVSSASYSLQGEVAADEAGDYMGFAGDVDGDGLDDVIIGSTHNSDGGVYAGKSYIILADSLGSASALELATADYSFIGGESGDYACVVAGAGDVDGDGLADVLIGATGYDGGGHEAGAAFLVLGSGLVRDSTVELPGTEYTFLGWESSQHIANSLSTAGDVDGDGLSDLLIGTNSDGAFLVLASSVGGSSTTSLEDADYRFYYDADERLVAGHVASAGDLDGDGADDLIFGLREMDWSDDEGGQVNIVMASSLDSDPTFDLATADLMFVEDHGNGRATVGSAAASAGDVDGDSRPDLMIGAPYDFWWTGDEYAGEYVGSTFIFLNSSLDESGVVSLDSADAIFVGSPNDQSGSFVSTAGDVNRDGLSDILIGAPGNDEGGTSAGKAYLLLSPGE